MKYSTLILTLLMFCITGRSQVASGREDRAYWISILSQVSDPLLNNMSKGELRKNMPVETVSGAANPSNARTTHLEALGRLLVGIAPWLELGPDETSEGQLREKYIQLMLKLPACFFLTRLYSYYLITDLLLVTIRLSSMLYPPVLKQPASDR